MAEKLCGGNVGLALLANAIATGGALVALILAFGPQSGAHMNPVVTLAAAATEGLRWHAVPAYIDTFAGIRPVDAPGFILAQFVALALALPLLRRSSPGD
jgi:glycerol uptake facilitator-like aquaporin